jgi:integrase
VGYADYLTPMCLIAMNTGLRRGELFSLTWEAVDLNRKVITVLASHSKGNSTRHVPLNRGAAGTDRHPARPRSRAAVYVAREW